MTELIIVRHGETNLNRAGSFQGQIDEPLNERGHAQAQRLAERLSGERFDVVYSSDLKRALQTAEPVARQLAQTITPILGLREQHFGELEGMTLTAVKEQFPGLWDTWLLHQADFAVPGGESVRQFSQRVLQSVWSLSERHAGQRLLVVAHGGVLDMVYRHAKSFSLNGPRICPIPNTGVNRLRISGRQIHIEAWADDSDAL